MAVKMNKYLLYGHYFGLMGKKLSTCGGDQIMSK